MNEKLVSWFEDLLPEIKETGKVEPTLLKFARDKNLAPALLEKIGHVYNTAKTVNYLDKAASHGKGRGETFDILDVSAMMEKYTEKQAKNHDYSNNDFSSLTGGKFPDLFKDDTFDLASFDAFESPDDYHEVKLASEKHAAFFDDSVKKANSDTADQLIFDTSEDNREIAGNLSDQLRDSGCEYTFQQLEKDAAHYFGNSVKDACDYFHTYLSGIGMNEKRASDRGRARIIDDTSYIFELAKIQDNLNTIKMASDIKKKFFLVKESKGKTKDKDTETEYRPRSDGSGGPIEATGGPTAVLEALNMPEVESGIDKGVGHVGTAARGVTGALKEHSGLSGKSLGEQAATVNEFNEKMLGAVAPYRAEKQEQVDAEMDEAVYETVIQDLMITDPILSEEDEDKILDIYNTLKGVAPELAKDKNVMRVALRSAIQHDGISPFDLKQFAETERELQKVRNNIRVEKDKNYMSKKDDADYTLARFSP